jgi:hypothetical protein
MSSSVEIVRPVNLSPAAALELVTQFLPLEWSRLKESDIRVSRSELGISNEVYFVERVAGNGIREPNKVVIRKYAEHAEDKDGVWTGFVTMCASHQDQAVTHMQLAHESLGAKQYGLFAGGRIEEWIDCRHLTYEDACKPVIEEDIATQLARIHALDLPFRKPAFSYMHVLRTMFEDFSHLIPRIEEQGNESLTQIAKYDYPSLLNWMEPMMKLGSKQRMVFTNWDPHFGNIAVLNNPSAGGPKTMIFDFEAASYNMRGKDLCLFLLTRSGFHPHVRPDRKLESNAKFFPFPRPNGAATSRCGSVPRPPARTCP